MQEMLHYQASELRNLPQVIRRPSPPLHPQKPVLSSTRSRFCPGALQFHPSRRAPRFSFGPGTLVPAVPRGSPVSSTLRGATFSFLPQGSRLEPFSRARPEPPPGYPEYVAHPAFKPNPTLPGSIHWAGSPLSALSPGLPASVHPIRQPRLVLPWVLWLLPKSRAPLVRFSPGVPAFSQPDWA